MTIQKGSLSAYRKKSDSSPYDKQITVMTYGEIVILAPYTRIYYK